MDPPNATGDGGVSLRLLYFPTTSYMITFLRQLYGYVIVHYSEPQRFRLVCTLLYANCNSFIFRTWVVVGTFVAVDPVLDEIRSSTHLSFVHIFAFSPPPPSPDFRLRGSFLLSLPIRSRNVESPCIASNTYDHWNVRQNSVKSYGRTGT